MREDRTARGWHRDEPHTLDLRAVLDTQSDRKGSEMRAEWGAVTQLILQMLAEEGPMTRAEICRRLGREKDKVAATVTRLHRRTPAVGKRIHICEYVYDMEGERYYPRAVYALGDKLDAKKPKADQLEVKRRYRERHKKRYTANSVFNLGLTRRQIEERIRRNKEPKE